MLRFMARLVRRSLGEGGRAASYGAAVLHAPQVRFIYCLIDGLCPNLYSQG